MDSINMHDAKSQLSRLVDRAAAGEEILIAKAGKPVARLMPLAEAKPKRVLGLGKGLFTLPDGFDDPLADDILDMFEGKGKTFGGLFPEEPSRPEKPSR